MGSLTDLYSNNVSHLLTALQAHGTLARHELADITGLTRTTVSRAITDLASRGIVWEVDYGAASPRGGRKPIRLQINNDAFCTIGLDLRREKISGCLVHLGGQIASKIATFLPPNPSRETVLATLNSIVEHLMEAARVPIMGIGVGSIGPVNHMTGVVRPENFECMYNVPLGDLLSDESGLPVSVRTGACTAAIGEYYSKKQQGLVLQSLAFVVIDYGGIGVGMISNETLWKGNDRFGELGHTIIDYQGRQCECGRRGCLTMYASGKAALERMATTVDRSITAESLAQLAETAESGDKRAQLVLTDAGFYLGYGVTDIDRILRPDYIVIGSSHPYLERWYMEGLQQHASEGNDSDLADRIVPAGVGSYSIAYGAAAMQIRNFYDSPLSYLERLPQKIADKSHLREVSTSLQPSG